MNYKTKGDGREMTKLPSIGQEVIIKETGKKGKVISFKATPNLQLVTIEEESKPYKLSELYLLDAPEKKKETNGYTQMLETLEARLEKVKEEKSDAEDKLNDLEFEENHLLDAINALSELR